MIAQNKVRVPITMSVELDRKVSMYADAMGISRGQFITSIVGQHIMALDKSVEVVENIGKEMLKVNVDV